MALLRERGVVLEICPSSNLATRAVTPAIASDDPPMFGTTLNREYELAATLLEIGRAHV